MTFRPGGRDKHEFGLRAVGAGEVVRVGALRLEPETMGAIEELGLQVDDYLSPDDELEPRLEIEKLRALSEEAIKQIRDRYLQLESSLISRLSPEEQSMMQMTRPECLQEFTSSGFKERDDAMYGSVDSFEELKNVEKRMASEVKVLRDEVERLRKRVADSEGTSLRTSLTGSLNGQVLVNLLKSVQPDDSETLEKCSGVILETLENDFLAREIEIRREMEEQFEAEKQQIKESYEEQVAKAIEEARVQATEAHQSKGGKKPRADDLQSLRESIYLEVEDRLKQEYEEKLRKRLAQLAPKPRPDDYSELRERLRELETFKANQEVEFELRLASEKEAWKRELASLSLDDYRRELQKDFDHRLAQRTQEVQEQSKSEVGQLTAQFRAEAQDAISRHLQRLAEESERRTEAMKGMLREECLRELRSEREMKLSEALAARISVQLDKELRKDLTPKVEKELRTVMEEQLRMQLRKEFEDIYETRKGQMEQEMKQKLRMAQSRVEGKYEGDVNRLLQERTSKIEKELKIKYKTKLERIQKQTEEGVQQEYKQKHEEEMVELRREKSEVARLRSALNVQLKKANVERREELDRIRKQEVELDRKTKELNLQLSRVQIQEGLGPATETPIKSVRASQTPMKKDSSVSPIGKGKESKLSPQKYTVDSELIGSLPRPLSPPQLSRQSPPSSERNNDPAYDPPQRLLPHYDSQDLVKQLISKNLEDAQREALTLLQQTEKPPILPPRPRACADYQSVSLPAVLPQQRCRAEAGAAARRQPH